MTLLLVYLIGIFVGCILTNLFLRSRCRGELLLEHHNGSYPTIRMRLDTGYDQLKNQKKKFVTLAIREAHVCNEEEENV